MPAPDPRFWRGRRVLLTGHTGFKGAWAAGWLERLGAETTGIALDPPTSPSLFEAAGVAHILDDCRGDIRDAAGLREAVRRARPEIVLHFAAQSLVRTSYDDPVATYETNVVGTANLLSAVREAGTARAVICVTSDKCYRNREWSWPYRETDELGGHDPYSSSKACQELVAASYRDAYLREEGIALATVRAGNVIGGGDWARDRLVPDLVRAFRAGRAADIRNPLAVRPWQHVLEPLSGYLILAERLDAEGDAWADAWNFGPADRDVRAVEWVADRAADAWGAGATWRRDDRHHPHEAHALRLDWSRARTRLGWNPAWDLETALDRTLAFYRMLDDGAGADRVREIMGRDIEAWSGAARKRPA